MLDQPAGAAQPPTTARRDRSRVRVAVDAGEAAALNGAAILAILRRRKWLLMASILLCPLLAYVAITQLTPRYTATGKLLYDASEYKARELQSILQVEPITDAVMTSQAEVLRGMPVIEQMTSRLNLATNPEFNASLRPPSWPQRILSAIPSMTFAPAEPPAGELPGPQLDPERNATLSAVQDALTVSPVKASHVLEVSFIAQDPVLAAAAVNTAMDVYVKSQLGAKYGAAAKAQEWLKQRRDELRTDVRRDEDAIAKYRAQHGLIEGMHARLGSEQISLMGENLARARDALAESEAKLDAARGRAGATAQAAIAPSVVQLRARHDQLSGQLQSILGRLGPAHPDVQAVHAQLADVDRTIAAEIARVVTAIEADVRAARERVDSLQRDLSEQQAQIARDAQAQVPLNAMLRDAEASRGLLQSVLERLQQTAQQPTIEVPDAHEISLALAPGKPSFPRTGTWMAAATVFGIVLGLLLVYVMELADGTFRSGDDVRVVLGLPCLGLVPRVPPRKLRATSVEEYVTRRPHSVLAEQPRALHAGLSLATERPRVVAVTAARAKEGKTTLTHALACLAALNGERVIVVDCDLRHPAHDRDSKGLIECLREQATLAEVIRRQPMSGADFLPSGGSEPNGLGLLMSGKMAQVLAALRCDYDLVLLDTPPAEVITDARVIAGLADATLFFVHWHATSRAVALHALRLLEEAHANVVGAALTQVDARVHVRSGYADAEAYHPRYGGYFRE